MKKVVLTVVVMLVLGVLAEMHLSHESMVEGYLQGCEDTIKNASNGAEFPDQVIQSYCHVLADRYVRNKQ